VHQGEKRGRGRVKDEKKKKSEKAKSLGGGLVQKQVKPSKPGRG